MEDVLADTIFEERKAVMISPSCRTPTLRPAHFLRPCANSVTGQVLKLPSVPLPSVSSWPLTVYFNGWHDPLKKWSKWVKIMQSKYEFIWRKSGIYEAILSSTYQIRKNSEVVCGVAERWCSETSTFMFPWGEATITLEDMMVLGGFSVLGSPVLTPLESRELVEIEELLKQSKESMRKSKNEEGHHCNWLDHFMGSGSNLEHEAFLSLWLSRFVLPGNVFDAINDHNFSVAIYLARGFRIAFGPTVLASLYRDLCLLKESIVASSKFMDDGNDNYLALTLWSPMQFVQVWAWERLPPLQPKPKSLSYLGEPRLVRWHGVDRLKRENIRWIIDSAVDNFLWRPYAISLENWRLPQFYKENEQWVSSGGDDLSEEVESYARSLRVSELVGVDSIELYLPHRVAMQFGVDQDLPRWIPKSSTNPESAWDNYTRLVLDDKLYFPARLFEADITTRYLEWWEKSVLNPQDKIKDLVKGKSTRRSRKSLRNSKNHVSLVPQKSNWGKNVFHIFDETSDQEKLDENVTRNCVPSTTECNDATDRPKQMLQTCKNDMQNRTDINDGHILSSKKQCLQSSAQGSDANVAPGFGTKEPTFPELKTPIGKLERILARLHEKKFGCRNLGK